jgi:methylmalonyl-CoA mutase
VVLQDEANLGRVIDPAGGSWYVELLTDELGRRAWDLLQEVEQQGGMGRALAAGSPQQRIAETAAGRQAALASRKQVLVGTNMYPNTIEKPLEPRGPELAQLQNERGAAAAAERGAMDDGARQAALDALREAPAEQVVELAIAAVGVGATLGQIGAARLSGGAKVEVPPLATHRAGEAYERLGKRAAEFATRTGARPRVFLANLGPIPQHKARADFSTGFFEVGGFEVIGNDGFPTPEEAADAAIESGAQVVVACSTDPTYPELIPTLASRLKAARPDAILVLAGYPKDQIDAHRESGVDEFIHLKANNHGMLVDLLERIGA